MTQEEKAKAYDKAIERAKSLIGDTIIEESGQHIAEVIFPELKESEDERIRKEIIKYIKTGTYHKDWLAWLEKQGEQKSNPYSGTSFEYNGHTWGMCARDNGIDILCDKHIIGHLEKQSEQKSILNVPTREVILSIWDLGNEWKELTNGCISTEYGTQLDYIQKHWQESEYYLREKQGEQKPTIEMKTPEESLCIDSETYNKIVDECIYGEQKSAWSEEDERLCNCIIQDQEDALDDVRNDKYGHSEIISDLKEMYRERINWLKALKQRIGG